MHLGIVGGSCILRWETEALLVQGGEGAVGQLHCPSLCGSVPLDMLELLSWSVKILGLASHGNTDDDWAPRLLDTKMLGGCGPNC